MIFLFFFFFLTVFTLERGGKSPPGQNEKTTSEVGLEGKAKVACLLAFAM